MIVTREDVVNLFNLPGWKALAGLGVALAAALVLMMLISSYGSVPVAQAAACTTWDLAADYAARPAQNPNPDSCGNAGVWSYLTGGGLAHAPGSYTPLPV